MTDRLVLEASTLIDGAGVIAAASEDVAVVVESGRIAWVGPLGSCPPAQGAERIGDQRFTLMPGLIDSHVHLTSSSGPDFAGQVTGDGIPTGTLRALDAANRHLLAGVTTVRDCGARGGIALGLAAAIEEGLAPGARVQAAGRVITMTGGHGHFIGVEADGPDEVRKAVRGEIKAGAHFVKVMATGGVITAGIEAGRVTLGLEELRVVTEEAHNAGRKVAAHAIGLEGIKNALRAGVDSIEHGFVLDEEAIEMFLSSGAYLVPTLSGITCALAHGVEGGIAPWMLEKSRRLEEPRHRSFELALSAGVRIAAGTDAGTPFNQHGGLASELKLMVGWGMDAAQAVESATVKGAANLGLEDDIGAIEVGRVADLILVEGDPRKDIDALSRIACVVKGGKVVGAGL